MRKVIYICDECGNETEDVTKVTQLILEQGGSTIFNKLLCQECKNDVIKLVNNNLMVIDPFQL